MLLCLKFFLWLCLPLSVSLFSLLSYFYSPLTFLHYHCPISHYEWTVEVLVGYHLMEPLLGILLDQQPRPTHLALRSILQNLYKQMMEPIPGFKFSSVERHALPALEDGFGRKYKQEWMESFCKHLEQYDVNKLQRKSWWNSLLQLCQGNEEFSMNLVQNTIFAERNAAVLRLASTLEEYCS